MDADGTLWEYRRPTTEDAAYQRKIWERQAPVLLSTCDGFVDELDRIRGLIEEFADGNLDPLVALGKIGLGGQRG